MSTDDTAPESNCSGRRVWLGYVGMILFAAAAFGVIGSYGKSSLAVPAPLTPESLLRAPSVETPAGSETANAIAEAQPNSGFAASHAFRSVLVALVAILVAARIFGCLVATVGKLGGTALAARYCRMDWRTSAELGALMNTRGLVEIIVLDLGLQLGVITAPLFAMMVVMAIATTLMTGPMLSAIARWFGRSKPDTILQTGTTSAAWCRVAGR